ATPELFAVLAKVAHEYKLPFLAPRFPDERRKLLAVLSEKDVILDSVVMANPTVRDQEWKKFYTDAIKNLKPGLSEMIVHLGGDESELQGVAWHRASFGPGWWQRA